jgi:hypothetical protein
MVGYHEKVVLVCVCFMVTCQEDKSLAWRIKGASHEQASEVLGKGRTP